MGEVARLEVGVAPIAGSREEPDVVAFLMDDSGDQAFRHLLKLPPQLLDCLPDLSQLVGDDHFELRVGDAVTVVQDSPGPLLVSSPIAASSKEKWVNDGHQTCLMSTIHEPIAVTYL